MPLTGILFWTEGISCNIFRCNYLRNKTTFSQFFCAFSKSKFNFEHFQKKRWPSELMYFWTDGLRKAWLDKCLKSPVSEDTLTNNMQTGQNPFEIWTTAPLPWLWFLWKQIALKKSLWDICKMLGLFVKPLSANNRHSLLNRWDLLQHFKMHLSQKRKIFSESFFAFFKSRFNFEHFEKKDDAPSPCIFQLTDSEKRGKINV